MTLRIRARAGEAIPAGETVVIENGKVMVDKTPKKEKPLKPSYQGFALFDRFGVFWDADPIKKNLESFKQDLEEQRDPNGPFRIVRVKIQPVVRK